MFAFIKNLIKDYKEFSVEYDAKRKVQLDREERHIAECVKRREVFPMSEFKD